MKGQRPELNPAQHTHTAGMRSFVPNVGWRVKLAPQVLVQTGRTASFATLLASRRLLYPHLLRLSGTFPRTYSVQVREGQGRLRKEGDFSSILSVVAPFHFKAGRTIIRPCRKPFGLHGVPSLILREGSPLILHHFFQEQNHGDKAPRSGRPASKTPNGLWGGCRCNCVQA